MDDAGFIQRQLTSTQTGRQLHTITNFCFETEQQKGFKGKNIELRLAAVFSMEEVTPIFNSPVQWLRNLLPVLLPLNLMPSYAKEFECRDK